MEEGEKLSKKQAEMEKIIRKNKAAVKARGLLRTSTRPTSNRRTEPRVCLAMAIHPEGESCSDLGPSAWCQ